MIFFKRMVNSSEKMVDIENICSTIKVIQRYTVGFYAAEAKNKPIQKKRTENRKTGEKKGVKGGLVNEIYRHCAKGG